MKTKITQIRVDGYKNLIDCKIDLNDFNVLVGSNNSGKTNLIEAIQMLGVIAFSTGDISEDVLSGKVGFSPRLTSSISHLTSYADKPLTLGVCFETEIKRQKWIVDYEVKIQCGDSENVKAGYLYEHLKAKPKSRTGPFATYIKRTPEKLTLNKRPSSIARGVSALTAMRTLYPEFKNLKPELKTCLILLLDLWITPVFAIHPSSIRSSIDSGSEYQNWLVSSFDPLLMIDRMKEDGTNYEVFTEMLCEILDLEDVNFVAHDIKAPATKSKKVPTSKRSRLMTIKRKGSDYVNVEEFSDGTFLVIALLAGILSPGDSAPLICIEELENYLHPAAIDKLLQFLKDYSSERQILITTHSPYLLNAVRPEDVNVAVVDETGATHFEKLNDRKKIEDRLKHGYMNFGDLLVSNYEDILNG